MLFLITAGIGYADDAPSFYMKGKNILVDQRGRQVALDKVFKTDYLSLWGPYGKPFLSGA